jgi:hypothetical protein
MKKDNLIKYGIITVFVSLYLIVSTISMIHSIDFFGLSNSSGMALALASAFEIGQVAALCGILILDKTNRVVIWSLFLLLTSMQIMSNVYFSYKYLGDYSQWAEREMKKGFTPQEIAQALNNNNVDFGQKKKGNL